MADLGTVEALRNASFKDIASILDAQELQALDADFSHDWPAAAHILGHLYNYDLPDARYVWKRLPDVLKQERVVTMAFQLLQAMWNKDYQGVWQALNRQDWGAEVAPLAAALAEKVRAYNAELITRAYSSIAPSKAAALLGLPEAQAVELAERAGWGRRDVSSGLITVTRPAGGSDERVTSEHLARLTQYVTHLEAS
ncbi:hypothetical protein WJX81_006269 [Elliptochloris bilobata]|uniref:CSN8/PSMD8/EIF3K domain-containing protein n=1 Tax=Elliptochloris bilobata TaxID=381761 RepID=A0AAW1SG15_9CHLO